MSNVKIEKVKLPKPKIIKDREAFKVLPGVFLFVVSDEEEAPLNNLRLVIRTNNDKHPFVNVNDGGLWGDNIGGYEFEEVKEVYVSASVQ